MKPILFSFLILMLCWASVASPGELAQPTNVPDISQQPVVKHIAAHIKQYLVLLGALVVLFIILSFYRQHKRHEDGVVEYNDTLRAALGQTQITPKELDKLLGIQAFYRLSDKEVKEIRVTQFGEVFANTPPESFTLGQGLAKLEGIRKALELSEADVADITSEIDRIKRRSEMSKGSLPDVASPISLKEGEVCHFASEANLLEGPTPEGEGIKFDFGRRAVYFRDGELLPIPQKGLTIGDMGKLVLTSKRIAFTGKTGPFQFEYEKLKGVMVFFDAVGFYPDERNRWFKIEDPETAAVIASKVAQEHIAV